MSALLSLYRHTLQISLKPDNNPNEKFSISIRCKLTQKILSRDQNQERVCDSSIGQRRRPDASTMRNQCKKERSPAFTYFEISSSVGSSWRCSETVVRARGRRVSIDANGSAVSSEGRSHLCEARNLWSQRTYVCGRTLLI